ncbi:MAG: hypothetical protein RL653_3975 [Pseudomonadota bacterium]
MIAACTPALPCGTAEVSTGAGRTAALLTPERPLVMLVRGESTLPFLLDTGFRRSGLAPGALAAQGQAPSSEWRLEDVRIRTDFAAWTSATAAGVLGAEVLEQVPLGWNAAEGQLSLASTFPPPSEGDVPLRRHERRDCTDPGVAFTLEADLEGRRLRWLLDTGAEHSVVRTSVAEALAGQPGLRGLRLETGFAGVIGARAHRASALRLGDETLERPVVLSGPSLDAELERQSAWLGVEVDGLLGWNVLREGTGGWRGPHEGPPGALAFVRLPSSPWPRALVGVGVALRPAEGGLEVLSVYEPSPALEAGLSAGDVLVEVDGRPAAEAPTPFAPVGATVTLRVRRGADTFERDVVVADLLPDVPPQ